MKGFPPHRYFTDSNAKQRLHGFTIVELLIVVVVIAILAAIIIVAYNGITANAKESSLKSDLKNGVTQLELARVDTGTYPGSSSAPNFKTSGDNNLVYSGGGTSFCLQASSLSLSGKVFYATQGGTIQEGECGGGVATTMQTFTSAHCSDLAVYTGSNPAAIQSLTDSRGGTTRTYEVAKLADGKCWMLTNLKLGSTSGTITLTPSDSDVASNFTLPQLTTGGGSEYDLPRAYGPVSGDTGVGAANYGYLYNWAAATAGESRTTAPAGSGNVTSSICPEGWRLPTGGGSSSDFGQLDIAFGGTGVYMSGSSSVSSWQPEGVFHGSLSGGWDGGFYGQGSWGHLWSSSTYPIDSHNAFYANFAPSYVSPGDDYYDHRYGGVAVRCLLQ